MDESKRKCGSSLENCFREIIQGKPLQMELRNVYDFLKYLQININPLQSKLQTILPFLLIHFMKSWPGWQKSDAYFNNELTFEDWFGKFREFLSLKLNFVIKNEIIFSDDVEKLSLDNPFLFGIDNSTQTDNELEISYAPYSIEIEAPPRFLNTMIFSEGLNDDIILKEHNSNVEWSEKLTIRQMINWPYVEIEFNSKELHFKRSNLHSVKRYLGYKFSNKKLDGSCIMDIDVIDMGTTRISYSLNIIKEYCNLYICLLRKLQKKLNWSDNTLEKVEIILEDLILDLIDIDKNSIATNTKVLFNIGNCTYNRNRCMKKSAELVTLTELIVPSTLLSFIGFTAYDAGEDPFPLLKLFEKDETDNHLSDLVPSITYRCTFCGTVFPDDDDVWLHLRTAHAMELPVMCFRCEHQFTIPTLTQHRWRHQCLSKSSDKNLNSNGKS